MRQVDLNKESLAEYVSTTLARQQNAARMTGTPPNEIATPVLIDLRPERKVKPMYAFSLGYVSVGASIEHSDASLIIPTLVAPMTYRGSGWVEESEAPAIVVPESDLKDLRDVIIGEHQVRNYVMDAIPTRNTTFNGLDHSSLDAANTLYMYLEDSGLPETYQKVV